jgi:rubrerythrin
LLLIFIWSLFLIKNLFDLIDFKVNERFYSKLIRDNSKKSSKLKSDLGFKNLIKCHNCGYMCRISWKECPICKSYIKKRSSRY